jgi:hypothetical protein
VPSRWLRTLASKLDVLDEEVICGETRDTHTVLSYVKQEHQSDDVEEIDPVISLLTDDAQ